MAGVMKEDPPMAPNELPAGQVCHSGEYGEAVRARIDGLAADHFNKRLWRKDPTLWPGGPGFQLRIRNSLGWLNLAEQRLDSRADLSRFVAEVHAAGFRRAVYLSMDETSVIARAFERISRSIRNDLPLAILDTLDPATIRRIEQAGPLDDTLFVVASRSGTDIGILELVWYFYTRIRERKGKQAGQNFAAITHSGTLLAELGHDLSFRRIFFSAPDVPAGYGPLDYFGLLPAALTGADLNEFLARARRMALAGESAASERESPGVVLGAHCAELLLHGRDKATFLLPKPLAGFGEWVAQLLAGSIGKKTIGIVPIVGEIPGDPSTYGRDRFFVHMRLEDSADRSLERSAVRLQAAGYCILSLTLQDRAALGQEFLRWQIASTVPGYVLGLDPFDEPNMREGEAYARRLLADYSRAGWLPQEPLAIEEGPLRFYAGRSAESVRELLTSFLGQGRPGDYVAVLAYLPETSAVDRGITRLRNRLWSCTHLATTVGYGPRYLHVTGQLHLGGPNTGLFLLLTADDIRDMQIPDEPYSFGMLKMAQALGDLEALRAHGRRAIRVHLGDDVARGLNILERAFGF